MLYTVIHVIDIAIHSYTHHILLYTLYIILIHIFSYMQHQYYSRTSCFQISITTCCFFCFGCLFLAIATIFILCFLFITVVTMFFLCRGSIVKIVSLSSQGRGNVCVYTTLRRPHLLNFTKYVVVVVVVIHTFLIHTLCKVQDVTHDITVYIHLLNIAYISYIMLYTIYTTVIHNYNKNTVQLLLKHQPTMLITQFKSS